MLVFFRDSFDIRRSTWSIEWPVRCISANLIFHFAFVTQRKTKSRHSFLVERIFVRERWLRPFASFFQTEYCILRNVVSLNCHIKPMWLYLTQSMLPSTVFNLFPPMKFSRWRVSIVSYNRISVIEYHSLNFFVLFLYVWLLMWHWRGMLSGRVSVKLWCEQRNYCRYYHQQYCLLRLRHLHCILPLLCFLPEPAKY